MTFKTPQKKTQTKSMKTSQKPVVKQSKNSLGKGIIAGVLAGTGLTALGVVGYNKLTSDNNNKPSVLDRKFITIKSSPKKLLAAANIIYMAGKNQQNFNWALARSGAFMATH